MTISGILILHFLYLIMVRLYNNSTIIIIHQHYYPVSIVRQKKEGMLNFKKKDFNECST
jgi:hypothetical protein